MPSLELLDPSHLELMPGLSSPVDPLLSEPVCRQPKESTKTDIDMRVPHVGNVPLLPQASFGFVLHTRTGLVPWTKGSDWIQILLLWRVFALVAPFN